MSKSQNPRRISDFDIKEFIFNNVYEMSQKMECEACLYEGHIKGRQGYNFPNKDGSYTIAYIKGDIVTKKHEMRHAMFFFDKEYRKEVIDLWNSFSEKEQDTIEKFLCKCGYKREQYIDEFGAYWFSEQNPRRFFGLKKL